MLLKSDHRSYVWRWPRDTTLTARRHYSHDIHDSLQTKATVLTRSYCFPLSHSYPVE